MPPNVVESKTASSDRVMREDAVDIRHEDAEFVDIVLQQCGHGSGQHAAHLVQQNMKLEQEARDLTAIITNLLRKGETMAGSLASYEDTMRSNAMKQFYYMTIRIVKGQQSACFYSWRRNSRPAACAMQSTLSLTTAELEVARERMKTFAMKTLKQVWGRITKGELWRMIEAWKHNVSIKEILRMDLELEFVNEELQLFQAELAKIKIGSKKEMRRVRESLRKVRGWVSGESPKEEVAEVRDAGPDKVMAEMHSAVLAGRVDDVRGLMAQLDGILDNMGDPLSEIHEEQAAQGQRDMVDEGDIELDLHVVVENEIDEVEECLGIVDKLLEREVPVAVSIEVQTVPEDRGWEVERYKEQIIQVATDAALTQERLEDALERTRRELEEALTHRQVDAYDREELQEALASNQADPTVVTDLQLALASARGEIENWKFKHDSLLNKVQGFAGRHTRKHIVEHDEAKQAFLRETTQQTKQILEEQTLLKEIATCEKDLTKSDLDPLTSHLLEKRRAAGSPELSIRRKSLAMGEME